MFSSRTLTLTLLVLLFLSRTDAMSILLVSISRLFLSIFEALYKYFKRCASYHHLRKTVDFESTEDSSRLKKYTLLLRPVLRPILHERIHRMCVCVCVGGGGSI